MAQSPQSSSGLADVIFLDIDGVMLPFGDDMTLKSDCGAIFPDSTLSALSCILEETGASLVLSSTWRAQSKFVEQILDSFCSHAKVHGGGLSNVQEFYDVTDLGYHGERQWEIRGWLDNHRDKVRAWIALDDEDLLRGYENARYHDEFVGHVIMTDSRTGLTHENARLAISLMKQQVERARHQHTSLSNGR